MKSHRPRLLRGPDRPRTPLRPAGLRPATGVPAIRVTLLLFLPVLPFLAGCAGTEGPHVDLAADTDRDGVVDFRSDEAGEETWSLQRGALFLNNNDSERGEDRRARSGNDSERNRAESDEQGPGHPAPDPDHADRMVNGGADLEDLAPLRLRVLPDPDRFTRLQISVDEASRERVRLFLASGPEGYRPVEGPFPVTIVPGVHGEDELQLRIEGRSYADADWDGEVLVTARLVDEQGEVGASDAVRLRVAPWIMLSNLQEGTELYVKESPGRNDRFIEQLKEIVPAARAELVLIPEDDVYAPGNVWVQDAMEIGYTQMPGQRMSVVLKANRDRALDRYPRRQLLGPGYGWFACGSYRPHLRAERTGNGWLDWYGNLDVSPPVPGYPLGRVYYGANGPESLNPEIVAMLDAQGVQGPAVRLDTGWFLIKHVDEMVCFVPAGEEERPHRVLVPSTRGMIELLEGWAAEGLGDAGVLGPFEEDATVASLLADEALITHNRALQTERIEPNLEILKEAFGLRDEDFIPIPALVSERGTSVFPNMVNSVVLNGHLLVSDPHGPEPEGTDLLQEHVRGLLGELPLTLHFMDDRRYHRGSGNTHCATNVRREGFEQPWWERLAALTGGR